MSEKIVLNLNSGVCSARDPVLIGDNLASAVNVVIDNLNCPQKVGALSKYNQTGLAGITKGHISFLAEDGKEYTVVAVNNLLYYTSGDGIMHQVLFKNKGDAVSIDTANWFYTFTLYDGVISGTQQKLVYVTAPVYPIIKNAIHTGDIPNTIYSRGIRLQVYNSTIIAVNIYSSTDGGATPGTDEVSIGSGAYVPFPKSAVSVVKIFDRMIAVGYADAPNGWIASIAQASADAPGVVGAGQGAWTGVAPDPAASVGGGKYPEKFSGAIVLNSSVLMFSRRAILRLDAAAGPIANWRETFIPTTLGAISNQSIVLHSDGWVYYVSEQGICRTNGQIAERVDWDIQDDVGALSQLKNNSFSLVLNSSSDWNAGTPASGDNLLSTTGALIQRPQASQADWNAGTLTDVSTSDVVNSVVLAHAQTTIVNGGFDSDLSGWENPTSAWVWNNTDNQTNPGHAQALGLYTDKPFYGSYFVVSTMTGVLSQYINNTDWTKYSFSEAAMLAAGIMVGQTLTIAIYGANGAGGQSPLAQDVTWIGGDISLYAKQGFSSSHYYDIYIDTVSAGISSVVYKQTGNIITQPFDFGFTPTTLGSISAWVNIPVTGGTIQFLGATSADNITYSAYTSLGTASYGTTNFTASLAALTLNRYVKIKAIITDDTTYPTQSPQLINLNIGGQWVSATKNLGSIPVTWGTFVSNESLNNQTIDYEMDTSVDGSTWDGWQSVANGAIPTNPVRQYVRFRLTFDTNNYAQLPQTSSITLNWGSSLSALISPCAYSFQDRLYFSFMPNGGTYNSYIWMGQTKPTLGLNYEQSQLSGYVYPLWTKLDFTCAMSFSTYAGNLMIADALGYLNYLSTGITSNVCTQSAHVITKAVGLPDAQSLLDYLYIYASGDTQMNLYWRTKTSNGADASHDWSAWSAPINLQLQRNTGRVIQVLQQATNTLPLILADDSRIGIPGIEAGDFIQFKLEQPNADSNWSVSELHIYLTPQAE